MGNRAGIEGQRPTGIARAYHPWNDAGERHGSWIIKRVDLGGLQEVLCLRRRVILLEKDRTKWERRSDLGHAIAHIDLGHSKLDDKTEAAAVRLAAKRLLHRDDVADALAWTQGEVTMETAEMLGVDIATLFARLTHLHPAERGYFQRRLA